MLWIKSCPVSTKELFLKIAVSKRETKALKSNCEVVRFYYICKLYTWNLLETIFTQAFLKDFAKHFLKRFCWFPFIWNSKKFDNLLRRSFLIFFSLSIYHSSPFFYPNFGSAFFIHLPVVVSANMWLKVTPKNLK